MPKKVILFINCLLTGILTFSQSPLRHWTDAFEIHYTRGQPVVSYVLTIDTTDLSFYRVEMHVRNIRDTFEVAMVAHPEYDDRYWRFVEDIHVETKSGPGSIVREDSALWRIGIKGNE